MRTIKNEKLQKAFKEMIEPVKQDNPVPSLSHDLAEEYADYANCNRDRYLSIHAFIRWYNEKYGVETNKVRPNKDTYTTIYCKKNNSAGNCSCKGVCNRGWKDF